MNLFGLGLAMLGCSVGMIVGAWCGHAAGYERGKRDLYADLQRRLKNSQRETSEP